MTEDSGPKTEDRSFRQRSHLHRAERSEALQPPLGVQVSVLRQRNLNEQL